MGRRTKQTFLQRGHHNGQQGIANHQQSVNQTHSERLTPVRRARVTHVEEQVLQRTWRKGESLHTPYTLLVGMHTDSITADDMMKVPPK